MLPTKWEVLKASGVAKTVRHRVIDSAPKDLKRIAQAVVRRWLEAASATASVSAAEAADLQQNARELDERLEAKVEEAAAAPSTPPPQYELPESVTAAELAIKQVCFLIAGLAAAESVEGVRTPHCCSTFSNATPMQSC